MLGKIEGRRRRGRQISVTGRNIGAIDIDTLGSLRVKKRRPNQSILKEISSEYSLEGQMLKAEAPILWPPDAKN